MKYNPDIHHRRSIRLKGYDYSQDGAYFVTICTQNRECLFGQPVPGSIPTIIRSFKSAVTKRINQMYETPGVKLWQRNYYDHIIRNEYELKRIREYIANNPVKWEFDRYNPVVSILETTTNGDKK